jgi:hypothetical protein
MSPGRLLAVLSLATLLACSGGGAQPPDPQGPALPSASLGESTVGAPFERSLAASGGTAPLSYSAQGLPAGLALDPGTGKLSGIPVGAGTFELDTSVSDAAGRSDQRRYPLLILEAPHFVTASLPPATLGVSYAARTEATGGKAPLAYGLIGGTPPPGLSIDGSGTLSGTPSAAGTYTFELSVTDAYGSVKRASFTLEVRREAPVIVTTQVPAAYAARPYRFAFAASGGAPPYSWLPSEGVLPAGLSLSPSGELSGTPSIDGTATFTLEVRDAQGQSARKAFSLTVIPALVLTTSALPETYRGRLYDMGLEAFGGMPPYSYSIGSSALPSGMQFDNTGHFSGTPSVSGAFGITVTVQDSSQQSLTRAFTLTVFEPPGFANTSLKEGIVGQAYSDTLQPSGGKAPFTYRLIEGALPAGLQLSGNVITGTPTSAGTATFAVEILDAHNQAGTQSFPLRVSSALAVTSGNPPDGYTDTVYTSSLTASGGTPPYTWVPLSGSLPPGLQLSSSGQLSGTPAAAGSFTFSVGVVDAKDAHTGRGFSIAVYEPPALAAVPSRIAYVSDVINLALSVTGGKAPYSFTRSGTLPPGLSLSASSGILQGTLTGAGSFSFDITATDANGRISTRTVSFTVYAPPAISTSTLPDGDTSQTYNAQLTATGGQGTVSWSYTGTLPPGLSLSSSGALSGTPTSAGIYSFTARVTDAGGKIDSRSLNLFIQGPPSVATAQLADGYALSAYSATLLASGGSAPLSWSFTGSLPPGLSLSSTGVLSGTPSALGSFTFTTRVTDSLSRSGSRNLTLTVYRVPSVYPVVLGDAYVPEAYSGSIPGSDGKPPLTLSLASGALPDGLSLSSQGSLTGTPTAPGTASFTVMVQDANGRTGTRAFSLPVYSQPTFTTVSLPPGQQGQFYSQTLAASGGKPGYYFVPLEGSPPSGITLDWNGALTGTPTGGTSSFTVRVYDYNYRYADRTFTLSINYEPPHITTTSLPNAAVGTWYQQTLGYTGQWPLSWGYTGTLPPGLSFGSDGTILGMPTTPGTWTFTAILQDSVGGMDSRQFPLTVTGTPPDGGPDGGTLFTVGQWNLEWFGSDGNGPPRSTSDGGPLDDLQIAHARDVIGGAGAHLWGLVEMVDTADFQTLKAQLPGYAGFLSNDPLVQLGSSYYSPGEQKLGVLYDSQLTLQDARLILTEADVDFAGRPPLRVDFTTSIHGSDSALTVILVHMKAFEDLASYDRRQRASIALKNYLDTNLPSSRVLVLGDWNDDVDVSISHDTTGTPLPSPYDNFVSAPSAYSFVTRPLSLAGEHSTVDYPDMIDHALATDELVADYVPNSAHVLHPNWIPDYAGTTSDHYPVLSLYDFSDSPPLTLMLTGPTGGTWQGGSTLAITWNASPGIGTAWLEYSLDFGNTWTWLATLPDASVDSYLWSVPNVNSTGVLVRITDADEPWRQDTSDTPLTFVYVPPAQDVLINEFLANEPSGSLPDGGFGALTDYEFVELVNSGSQAADLSGWTLWDSTTAAPRHVFTSGTVLQPGKAWVIYGGPSAFPPGTPNTEAASSGRLGLNNSGTDSVLLRDPAGTLVSGQSYSSTVDNVSYNRSADGDSSAGFVLHTDLSSLPSSAGHHVDGSPF